MLVKRMLILACILMVSIHIAFAEPISSFEAYSICYTHIINHCNSASEDQLNRMQIAGRLYPNNENAWIFEIKATDFSDKPFLIKINPDTGEVYKCNCQEYSELEMQKHLSFCENITDVYYASQNWERRFGLHELWDVNTNASFCEKYSHLPYESEYDYYAASLQYGFPDERYISESSAVQIAYQILTTQFDQVNITYFFTGVFFVPFDSDIFQSYYMVNIYKFSYDMSKLTRYYCITIRAVDGACFSAIQYPLLTNENVWQEAAIWSEFETTHKDEESEEKKETIVVAYPNFITE